MSRIGKKILVVPDNTEVMVNGSTVVVKGPLGTLTRTFNPDLIITLENKELKVTRKRENSLELNALWGTTVAHLNNMIHGVSKSFEKKLIVEGVGFKWAIVGDSLDMALGFSHPVKMKIPEGIKAVIEKATLTISGFDKELVGSFAAQIRDKKKPEPYKGKGIRYSDEVIRRKQGKKAS
jgi:large subunit ribosomal protein L6